MKGPWAPIIAPKNQYQYNGKELNEDLGLNWSDYGFRWYSPILSRFTVIDPLSEKRYWINPYNYVQNNPILRIDSLGLTDYKINKKTGEVTQVGEKNDKPDRIVKTNRKGKVKYYKRGKRKGQPKIAIDNIEKGILYDGQNFKTDDQIINVNGEGQPSLDGVEEFIGKLSQHIGVEIGGAYLSEGSDANAEITKVYIDEYKGNSATRSSKTLRLLFTDPSLSNFNTITDFHTHFPVAGYNESNTTAPSKVDIEYKSRQKQHFKNFVIIAVTLAGKVVRKKY